MRSDGKNMWAAILILCGGSRLKK